MNQRARELLKVIDQVKGEFEIVKEREKAREEEYKELEAKCEAALVDIDKNPAAMVLRQKFTTLPTQVKDHKDNFDKMLLESQKRARYEETVSTLKSKVATQGERTRLEGIKTQLH